MDSFEVTATDLLRELTGNPTASFRDAQLDAIRELVLNRRRVLIVQRTGWGKSAVYFIATRMLRDNGSGPSLLVSPLLALMRNQIDAARRMNVRAETINSDNQADWPQVVERVRANEVDLLLISPERLANRAFVEDVLDLVGQRAGLVVVDEAHCISDWGHDFRPDYRRIERVLRLLPAGVPVLACTATANDRVVHDVVRQLGDGLSVFRGPLTREGLALQVISLDSPAARLAWLAQVVPTLAGSGIVYCLTVRDADTVAEWLRTQGLDAASYTGSSEDRPELERALLDNGIKVIVATSALGMGFDKPDLSFVIHFQSPGSVIHYYQQVGRAGRQLATSIGVLLRGREDRQIQDWFIDVAFPTSDEAASVVAALDERDGFVKLPELEGAVNIGRTRLLNILKNLEVDRFVVADGQRYQRTTTPYMFDAARVASISALRRAEQEQMNSFGTLTSGCRMAFLTTALDDPHAAFCGICDLCASPHLSAEVDVARTAEAAEFLRRRPVQIEPRKQWADRSKIPDALRVEQGRALCRWMDGGWGDLVKRGKQVDGRFDQQLVQALAELIRKWMPTPQPTWISWVPSLNHPTLVAQLAEDLGKSLGLPVIQAIVRTRNSSAQRAMHNSAQQLANVKEAFAVRGSPPAGPAILLDDIVDSRWTLTCVGALLRSAGVEAVIPVALADGGSS